MRKIIYQCRQQGTDNNELFSNTPDGLNSPWNIVSAIIILIIYSSISTGLCVYTIKSFKLFNREVVYSSIIFSMFYKTLQENNYIT